MCITNLNKINFFFTNESCKEKVNLVEHSIGKI